VCPRGWPKASISPYQAAEQLLDGINLEDKR
jgi:hypothetical protein